MLVLFGLVWFGLVWFGLVRFVSFRFVFFVLFAFFNLVWFDLVRFVLFVGLFWFALLWFGLFCLFGLVWFCFALFFVCLGFVLLMFVCCFFYFLLFLKGGALHCTVLRVPLQWGRVRKKVERKVRSRQRICSYNLNRAQIQWLLFRGARVPATSKYILGSDLFSCTCCHTETEVTEQTCYLSQCMLTPGQPVLALTLLRQAPGRVDNRSLV